MLSRFSKFLMPKSLNTMPKSLNIMPRTLTNTSIRAISVNQADRSYKGLFQENEYLPQNHNMFNDSYLEETEVITRMKFVIHQYYLLDLKTLDWDADFEDLGLDSLDQTAIITSIEHEFNTIFEDRVFDNFENFNQIKLMIMSIGSAA